ncbi:hypothetical protein IF2G_09532 [Cordyceps javanica]|nr:hypothetical protein IF2G_09532 [Cordyceps javanica]
MPCYGSPPEPCALAPRRRALELSQQEHFTRLYSTLRQDLTIALLDEQLSSLGIARGSPLDIDHLGSPEQPGFHVRLLSLESIEENMWQPVIRQADETRWDNTREAIEEAIGLELPRYEYYHDTLDMPKHEYKGTWAYFATSAADRPHAVCTMIDSSSPTNEAIIRSEVLAAVKMTEFQLQRACFTHHHTKPILVCTYFRNETARITQAHFDAVRDRFILRQSRLLDLSGPETPSDAWLMLRWMASGPVGLTQYQPSGPLPNVALEDGTSRPPQITLIGLSAVAPVAPPGFDAEANQAAASGYGSYNAQVERTNVDMFRVA